MGQPITVVVEWENAEAVGQEAALRLLRGLVDALLASRTAQAHPLRLLLVFDEHVDAAQLRSELAAVLPSASDRFSLQFLLTPGAPYYAKKGVVAHCVSTEFLAYADSDCAYVPDWLDVMMAPLLEGRTDLAFGDTVAMAGGSFMEKASALAWFFPAENPRDPLRARGRARFFANNFAVRTAAMRDCPPPRHDGSRSHGSLWMEAWDRAGLRREKVLAGVARHRQFAALGPLLARAWLFGYDKDVANALRKPGRIRRCARALAAYFELTGKFLRRWATVGHSTLGLPGMLAALPVGLAFQLVAAVSQSCHALRARRFAVSSDYTELLAVARWLS